MALSDVSCCEHTTYNILVYDGKRASERERSSPVDAAAGHFYNCKKKKVKKHQASKLFTIRTSTIRPSHFIYLQRTQAA
eukprot:scaffold1224_cov288-Chaetoceros_neogracile.AAC.4